MFCLIFTWATGSSDVMDDSLPRSSWQKLWGLFGRRTGQFSASESAQRDWP